jgi:hypothetical protein
VTVEAQISGHQGEPLVWTRSFAWGSLLVHDPGAEFIVPEGIGSGSASASSTVLAVPVLHQQDRDTPTGWPEDLFLPWAHVDVYVSFRRTPPDDVVQFECVLDCPSGHLLIGDADEERDVSVAPGRVRVQVGLVPDQHADVVVLRLLDAEAD